MIDLLQPSTKPGSKKQTVTVWDVIQMFQKGQGLRYVPLIARLHQEGFIDIERILHEYDRWD